MPWNWQLPDWPNFVYDPAFVTQLERRFIQGVGGVMAVLRHLDQGEQEQLIVEVLSDEGLKSSEIEGEVLERESLQISIRRHFGLEVKRLPVRERGMGDLMWGVYKSFEEPLTHDTLFVWQELLKGSFLEGTEVGRYRTHDDPMQIVSNQHLRQRVFFEAPPSSQVELEMERFVKWFNESKDRLSPLVRASIAHLYFESIHPFEDGNGRIGRAIVEKSLSQSLGEPILIAISKILSEKKREYYAALEGCNRCLEADSWIQFFADVIVDALNRSLELIHFLITKSKLLNSLVGQINSRQEKVLLRMFKEGPEGFMGGLSTENYLSITKTSRATATRDLADLVEKGALKRTGQLRHTRYWLITS